MNPAQHSNANSKNGQQAGVRKLHLPRREVLARERGERFRGLFHYRDHERTVPIGNASDEISLALSAFA